MRVLIGYWILGNAIEEFKRSQRVQRQFANAFACYDKVIVTDYAGPLETGFPVIRRDNLWRKGTMQLNVARNACVDHAQATGADWLILADADMVVTNWPKQWPKSGFSVAPQYHAPRGELEFTGRPVETFTYKRSSYFVIHRDVFSQHRFAEEMEGYGYNDTDYDWNVLWFAGIRPTRTDLRVLHLWHSPRMLDRREQTGRMRKVFAQRVAEAARRTGLEPAWGQIDPWSEKMVRDKLAAMAAPPPQITRQMVKPNKTMALIGDGCLPLVTAVMVTGKHIERLPLARAAVECFLTQTYPRKELLILNDGPVAIAVEHPEVREVRITPKEGRTLGELRNLAFSEARGEWLIQWDDDDWYAPERIAVQMNARQPGAAVFLRKQLRYSFTSGSAFVMGLHEGLHGTILHERGIKYRYPALSLGEDTEFMNLFHQHVIVENDPGIYVRFHHGYNSWEEIHIMKHLTGTRDRWEVDEQQKALMLEAVLPYYTAALVGREIY